MNNFGKYRSLKSFSVSIGSFFAFMAGLYYLADFSLFFSVGFSILLLVHELGHVVALWRIGGAISGIYFFPFVGAVVKHQNEFGNENQYAYVKYAGPLFGMFGVLIVLVAFFITGDERFLNLVYVGAVLNLVNMLPITLLDGYGVLRGSIKYVEWIGCLILIVGGLFIFHLYVPTLFFLLIAILFSESPTSEFTGWRWSEVILAIFLLIIMIVLTILEPDMLIWNTALVMVSIYLIGEYVESTCCSTEEEQRNRWATLQLPALTRQEKKRWIVRWVVLVAVLSGLAFYSGGYEKL